MSKELELSTSLETVLQAIQNGTFDSQIPVIRAAIAYRQDRQQVQKIASIRVGDLVEVTGQCNPRYLIGALARVTRVMQKYVSCDLLVPISGPMGKSWHRNIRMPVSLLTKRDEAPSDTTKSSTNLDVTGKN